MELLSGHCKSVVVDVNCHAIYCRGDRGQL